MGQRQRGQNPGWEHGPLGPVGGRRGGETRSGLEPRDTATTWVVWDGAARGPGEMPAAPMAPGRPPARPRQPARCEEGGPRGGPHPAAVGRAPALFVMGQCRHGEGLKDPPRTSATPAPDRRTSFLSPQWVAAPATEPTLTVGPSYPSFPFHLPSATPSLSSHAALQVKKLWMKSGPQSKKHTEARAAGCVGFWGSAAAAQGALGQ